MPLITVVAWHKVLPGHALVAWELVAWEPVAWEPVAWELVAWELVAWELGQNILASGYLNARLRQYR